MNPVEVQGILPRCKHCVQQPPRDAFCWVIFNYTGVPDGITHLYRYCPNCAKRIGSPIPRVILRETLGAGNHALPLIDARYGDERVESQKRMDKTLGTKKQLETMPYRDYLQTPHWLTLREKIKKRAKYKCQLCNETKNLNVHHRTYERRGREFLKDLICLCRVCHAKFHDRLPK